MDHLSADEQQSQLACEAAFRRARAGPSGHSGERANFGCLCRRFRHDPALLIGRLELSIRGLLPHLGAPRRPRRR